MYNNDDDYDTDDDNTDVMIFIIQKITFSCSSNSRSSYNSCGSSQ